MIDCISNSTVQACLSSNNNFGNSPNGSLSYLALGIIGIISIVFAYNASRKPAQHIHKKVIVEQPVTLQRKAAEGLAFGAGVSVGSFLALCVYKVAKKTAEFFVHSLKGEPHNVVQM